MAEMFARDLEKCAAPLKIFELFHIAASKNIPVQAHLIILLAAAANARLLNP